MFNLNLRISLSEPTKKDAPRFDMPSAIRSVLDSDASCVILKGGRGSAKSLSILRKMVEMSYDKSYQCTSFLCAREVKANAKDGVKANLVDILSSEGVEKDFRILENSVTNRHTSVSFRFVGTRVVAKSGLRSKKTSESKLKTNNTASVVFFEEAQDVSMETLRVMIPTIRGGMRGKSMKRRFFFAMNPQLPSDAVLKYFDRSSDGEVKVLHVNIFDIEPRFQDKGLLKLAGQQRGLPSFDHDWMGELAEEVEGMPFKNIKTTNEKLPFSRPYAYIDPSFMGGDFTSVCIASVESGERIHVEGVLFKASWTKCLDRIVDLMKLRGCAYVAYESNAVGDSIQKDLYFTYGVGSKMIAHSKKKELRIAKAAWMADNMVFQNGIQNLEFNTQVKEYDYSSSEHDDAPDSLAGVLQFIGLISE